MNIVDSFSSRAPSVSWYTGKCFQTCRIKTSGSGARHRTPNAHKSQIYASSSDSDSPAETISLAEARKILGVDEAATFEETVKAKNRLLGAAGKDSQRQMQIEVAYDALLMRSMQARLSGEAQADRDARYADVRKYRPPQPREKTWQEKVAEKLPGSVQIRQVSNDGPAQNLIFGTLAASALLQEFYAPPTSGSNVPGLQLGLAFGASLYYLTEKKKISLARSAGLTAAGLAIGTLLGSGLQAWLRVDIVPLGALHSPGVLVAECSIIGLWATSVFLA